MENPLAKLQQRTSPIDDVIVAGLPATGDARGTLTVFGRFGWLPDAVVQWNVSSSGSHVMRGVHAHRRHSDWVVAVSGQLVIGLYDLRTTSGTRGQSAVIVVEPSPHQVNAVFIPVGVAHGFYSPHASIHLYGTSEEWSSDDELGCRWDDPDLGLDWPFSEDAQPLISLRDAEAQTLTTLLAAGW